ncbi:hypothetical protein L3X38_018344 [Prunus dulcis]|uniref:Uncharacterized protein n=1 Tax=Prunus dulcis TaxID=3755 RepID=A0AAD4WAU5_PRUDU|nr:hypothetical protein L3X38_018344 [Prunus dulcis]
MPLPRVSILGLDTIEKEIRVVLSVKMVSQHQSKDSGSKKNGGKELGMVTPQEKSSKKMKFASSSAEAEPTSTTKISDDSKSGRGMSTMPRVVKRKLQKLRPIVEYNKRGKGIGQAHIEMQSYIGVLARSIVPLVDMKWAQIPKDIKEQIWEAVDIAFVKWKDFKSTLTRHYILQYTNDRERLSQPPETYKFIEKAQWNAFVASRLSKDFESVHSQHAQIREKLEYNHRVSRKGYVGLEDQLEETMPGVEIDRSTCGVGPGPLRHSEPMRGLFGAHWLRVRRNSEVKRVGGWSNPRMGDHPGKLLRELPETKPCGLSHSAGWCECADEDVGSLKGGGFAAQEQTREGPVVGAKADNIVVGGVGPGPLPHSEPMRGLLGAHWLRVRRNSEVKQVGGWSNPRMGDHPGKLLRELPETKPCGLDKHGNIPDPKVAEKAKLIDESQKEVSEGKVSVSGSNDVLTMALGLEHPGRVRAVGAGISPRQYFNLPKPHRMSFDDLLKDSLRVLLQEENKKMEAKAREEALRMEARTKQLVEAEREHFLSQLSQLIPNFDPSMLKPRISQSPKNPMSDKANCFGGDVRSLHFEDDTAKNRKNEEKEEEKKDEEKNEEKKDEEKKEEKQDEKSKEDEEKHDDQVIKVVDYSNMEAPSSLKSLCRYAETTLVPQDKTLNFTIDKEVFGLERDTFVLPEDITQFAGMEEIGATVVAVYMRYLHDLLKQANMCSMVGFIDPATVSANSGTIADRS